MEAGVKYIDEVFGAVRQNAASIKDVPTLQKLLEAVGLFYVSLFATNDRTEKIFEGHSMKRGLAKAPKIKVPRREQANSTSQEEDIPRRGLGKGRPGLPRKEDVTRRQKRNRVEKQITPMTTTTPVSSPSASEQSENRPAPEPRRELELQTITASGTKREIAIQRLGEGARDQPPTHKELFLFYQEMNEWDLVDKRLVPPLQEIQAESVRMAEDNEIEVIVKQMLRLAAMSNGVANCSRHVIGCMVREIHERHVDDDGRDEQRIGATLDQLQSDLEEMQYDLYTEALHNCGCDGCTACVEFDSAYKAFYDQLEKDEALSNDLEQPKFEDRPLHCVDIEMRVLNIKSEFTGLSSSSLENAYNFAQSTAPMTPPTLSTAPPTAVMGATTKYMAPYLRNRRLNDPLPKCWVTKEPGPPAGRMIKVNQHCLHFYDGDSCELYMTHNQDERLLTLAEGKGKLSIRTLDNDAPEMAFAVRLYKQAQNSTKMQHIVTRHIGVESLRAVRQMVFESEEIYLECDLDANGKPFVRYDRYRRSLANIWVRNNDGALENLAVKLASVGRTMSFYLKGINRPVDEAMRGAIERKAGMFNLPEEVFLHPFRPWDLRKRWPDLGSCPVDYKAYQQITNVPKQPERVWKKMEDHVDTDGLESDQETATYHFRMVESALRLEGICYKAPSTIPGAGFGLFLRPHPTIAEGTHLCLYATTPATKEELQQSSRDYALKSSTGKWYDAEVETGNNLGRFANMPRVKEALEKVVQLSRKTTNAEFQERQWKQLEDFVLEHCDATYKDERNQLVIISRREIKPSNRAHEIFASYGSIREYWLKGIHESPQNYPSYMVEIVQWLLTSPECNWSEAQRQHWVRE